MLGRDGPRAYAFTNMAPYAAHHWQQPAALTVHSPGNAGRLLYHHFYPDNERNCGFPG